MEEKSEELKKDYFDVPKIDKENDILMKGNIGIKINNLSKMLLKKNIFEDELSNYYNDLFKLKLISRDESI